MKHYFIDLYLYSIKISVLYCIIYILFVSVAVSEYNKFMVFCLQTVLPFEEIEPLFKKKNKTQTQQLDTLWDKGFVCKPLVMQHEGLNAFVMHTFHIKCLLLLLIYFFQLIFGSWHFFLTLKSKNPKKVGFLKDIFLTLRIE